MKSKQRVLAKQRQIYSWWYEFLKLNTDYQECCKKGGRGKHASLYRDFGDIFSVSFDRWYEERSETLFTAPHRFTFDHVETEQAFIEYSSDKTAVVAVINTAIPIEDLQEALPTFLRQLGVIKKGRPKNLKEFSSARYPLWHGPKTETLKKIYSVYKLHVEDPNAPPWKIGQKALAHGSDKTKPLDFDEKNRYRTMASKCLKQATALIENAAKNLFPVDYPANPNDFPSIQRAEEIYDRATRARRR